MRQAWFSQESSERGHPAPAALVVGRSSRRGSASLSEQPRERQCVTSRVNDVYVRRDAAYLEDLAHERLRAHKDQFAAGGLKTPMRREQHADTAGIDEANVFDVQDDALRLGVDRRPQRCVEGWRGGQVDLAPHLDSVGPLLVERTVGDSKDLCARGFQCPRTAKAAPRSKGGFALPARRGRKFLQFASAMAHHHMSTPTHPRYSLRPTDELRKRGRDAQFSARGASVPVGCRPQVELLVGGGDPLQEIV
jgi:hypothetical protein